MAVCGVSTAASAALAGGAAVTFATTIGGWMGVTASTGMAIASLSGAAAAKDKTTERQRLQYLLTEVQNAIKP